MQPREIEKTGDWRIDANALTLGAAGFGPTHYGVSINGMAFQQDGLVSHNGWQYCAYYDAERRICLARRPLAGQEWEVIRFDGYRLKTNDAHNVATLGIATADGTFHLTHDGHGQQMWFRISKPGVATEPERHVWTAELFSPPQTGLIPGEVISIATYPRFVPTPGGSLQLNYRLGPSGNGDRYLRDYDPATGKWSEPRQIDTRLGDFTDKIGMSPSRCSYPNGYGYGPGGRLHCTLTWREGKDMANHDLCYIYSDDGGFTWRNNAGEVVAESAPGRGDEGALRVDAPGLVVHPLSRKFGLMNDQTQTVDSQDRVHVGLWRCDEARLREENAWEEWTMFGVAPARHYYHYWRNTEGVWTETELPFPIGRRPQIFADRNDDLLLVFNVQDGPGDDLQPGDAIWSGSLNIARATAATDWTDWRIVYREEGGFCNEILGDRYRMARENVLSLMVQVSPETLGAPSELRVLDFSV
jgi:hypothetical protein